MKIHLKYIGALIFSCHFCCTVYGYDNKMLDIDARACSTKLWSEIPISIQDIEGNLGFINNLNAVDNKYGQLQEFTTFVETSKIKLNDLRYDMFAQNCFTLFCDSSNPSKKIAIHLLLEKVAQDYGSQLSKLNILKERAKEHKATLKSTSTQKFTTDKFLSEFLNADKAIHSN